MTPPDDDVQALLATHREHLRHRLPLTVERRVRAALEPRVAWRAPVLAAAACVLAFSLGWSVHAPEADTLTQEVVQAHVRALMVDHLADVASTDRHTVKPWFEGKLDFAPTVNDFTAEGFPLVGGRLDYLDGRAAAGLVFRSNQHVINLFEWPTTDASTHPPRLLSRRGYQLYTWQRDSLTYWAISDLNAVDLQTFAQLWQR
jgi:anti-sigma factor RsiW